LHSVTLVRVLSCLACLASPIAAQESSTGSPPPRSPVTPALPGTPPGPLTLAESVQIAIRNHPSLTAAAHDVEAAAAGVRSARALTNPSFIVAPALTSVSGSSDELLFQQPLEVNGTRIARGAVAEAELRTTRARAAVSLRDVVFAAKSAYFELARARERAAVARDALAIVREFDRIARRQVEEGARPGIDLAQTGLEVARAMREVTLADGRMTTATATLNTAIGRDPSTPVGALTPLSGATVSPLAGTAGADDDEAALQRRALASRAEIEAEESMRERFLQEARLARAEGVPDLAPQFRIGSFTRGLPPADSGDGAGIGVTITLPLFDYGSRRERVHQAETSAAAQEARIAAVRNDVRGDVIQSLARRRAAETIVRAYEGGVLDQARRLLEGSRIGFREGRTSVVALFEAQRSFRAIQTEYVDALVDAAVAHAELERAVGTVPPSLLPPTDTRP
jgi:cobalt-zinc-cadmium efflux system outer membrane protein